MSKTNIINEKIDFVMEPTFYFDDPLKGVSHQTSHPNFNKALKEEFYFNTNELITPFSDNNVGLSVLRNLEDWYREKGELKQPLEYVRSYLAACYGDRIWKYVEYGDNKETLIASGLYDREGSPHIRVDWMIIAIAFGQYKIEGKINAQLKNLGLQAIKRRQIENEYYLDIKRKIYTSSQFLSIERLQRLDIERLDIMEKDLKSFDEKQ